MFTLKRLNIAFSLRWEAGGRDVTPISGSNLNATRLVDEHLALRLSKYSTDVRVLEDLARRALNRLYELSCRGISWHMDSAVSALNIIAALFGYWVPRGLEEGIERVVVVSKGHCSLALYAWYAETGLISDSELNTFAKPGTRLQTHLERGTLPGIVAPTGSLGQGLSIANGIAIASRLDGVRREIAVLLGDGELDEGQVWEAAATASTLNLNNVTAVIDRNLIQNTGYTELVKVKEPLAAKWRAFGWDVVEVSRANVKSIIAGLERSSRSKRPTAIIIHTAVST